MFLLPLTICWQSYSKQTKFLVGSKFSNYMEVEVVIMRCGINKSLFRGLSRKYIFLAITYFCSSYITEEEINDLEKLLYLCYLVVLLREVAIHIYNRLSNLVFPRIRKRFSLCCFDWKENSGKGLRQWKKVFLN